MDATWPSYIYALKTILSIHNSLKNGRMQAFPIEIVMMKLSWCKNRKVAPINITSTLRVTAVLLENMCDALQQAIWCTLALTIQLFIHRLHARCNTLKLLIFLRDGHVDAQHGKMWQYVIKNDMTCINRLWLLYVCCPCDLMGLTIQNFIKMIKDWSELPRLWISWYLTELLNPDIWTSAEVWASLSITLKTRNLLQV